MNGEVMNEENISNGSSQPVKPLRKLKRINTAKPAADSYKGRYESENSSVSFDKKEAREESQRHGKYEAEVPQKEKKSHKDAIVKSVSIVLSIVMIFVLLLNMPILWYRKDGRPDERVSVVTYFKRWQPTVDIEGELEKPSMDFQINTSEIDENFTDGLDLPQLVEGQYTVLFLGFDEDEMLTDVVWVCEFDIAAAKLNILQIPRDTAVPDYTSNVTCKFNSVYANGDRSVTPIQRVVNAVQENFGIPIDAYITTTCFDIVDMVDLVGGIPISLDNDILYEAGKYIPAGDSVLSGEQAEWFVRYRTQWAEGDLGRMQNQRRFMVAAMKKLLSIVQDEGRLKLYSYLNTVYKNKWIATNMSVDDLSKLADFTSTLQMENIRVDMVPGEGAQYPAPDGNVYDFYSVHKRATLDLLNEYYRPYQSYLLMENSALVEYVSSSYYQTHAYDDMGATFEDLEDATEPTRKEKRYD